MTSSNGRSSVKPRSCISEVYAGRESRRRSWATSKLAIRYNHELAEVYEKERERGNANRATLAVARKLVAYLLAVDRRKQDFVPAEVFKATAAA